MLPHHRPSSSNEYYGSEWASFSLDGLIEWTGVREEPVACSEVVSPQDDQETILPAEHPSKIFRNIQLTWNIEQTATAEVDTPKFTLDALEKQSRKFNIDLAPKVSRENARPLDIYL